MKFKLEFELPNETCEHCPACGFKFFETDLQCNFIMPYKIVKLDQPRPEWCPLVEVKDE